MPFSSFSPVAETVIVGNEGSFSASRAATTGHVFPAANSPEAAIGYPGGVATNLNRLALAFDTSTIPADAVLVSAHVRVYPVSHSATHTLAVVPLTPDSGYPFGSGDFDSFTLGSTRYGNTTFPVGAVNKSWGISIDTSAITKAGTTYLGIISGGDYSNTETDAKLTRIRTGWWGDWDFRPLLQVRWTPPVQTVSPTLAGQSGGVLSSSSSESVTVSPTLLGQGGGVLAPSVGNLGGDAVLGEVLGSPSGVLPPAVLVGGVSTLRPNLLGTPGEVVSPTAGIRPRLLGPFSVLLDAPLRQGDRVTLTALLRRTGDEPIPLHEALGVELHATSQAGDPISDWGECTIEHPGDARVTYVFQVDDLVGVTSLDIVFRVRWRGGQTLVPTAPLTLAVT